jgi:hypothetical protein
MRIKWQPANKKLQSVKQTFFWAMPIIKTRLTEFAAAF